MRIEAPAARECTGASTDLQAGLTGRVDGGVHHPWRTCANSASLGRSGTRLRAPSIAGPLEAMILPSAANSVTSRDRGDPQLAQRRDQALVRAVLEFERHVAGLLGKVILHGIERGAAERHGVVEGLLDAHIEPGVDALVERLDREEIHHRHRQHRKQHEHAEQAQRQPRAHHARAVLRHQAIDVDENEREQQHQTEHVHDQQQAVQVPEHLGVLQGGTEHEQRHDQQQRQTRERLDAGDVTVERCTGHVVHPLQR